MATHRIFTRTTTTTIDRLGDDTFVLTGVLQDNVHDITLRLTVDSDLRILGAEGEIAASPFTRQCDRVSDVCGRLVGMQIGPGFSKEAVARLGGPLGCHRYVDLIREIARSSGQIPFLRLFHGDARAAIADASLQDKRAHALAHVPNLENSCWAYNRTNDTLFEVVGD